MSAEQAKRSFPEIAAEYAPYHTMPAFEEGMTAYMEQCYNNPYVDPKDGVKAQAWDRGLEAVSRYTRQYQ